MNVKLKNIQGVFHICDHPQSANYLRRQAKEGQVPLVKKKRDHTGRLRVDPWHMKKYNICHV